MTRIRRLTHETNSNFDHEWTEACNDRECFDVVIPETTKLPEFEIAISYHHFPTPNGIFLTGWKYSLHWKNKKGEARTAYKYGHETKYEARRAAESKATSEALAEIETETYNFTPEVD